MWVLKHMSLAYCYGVSVYFSMYSLNVLPEHEAGVTAVGVSEDGMKILAATASVIFRNHNYKIFFLSC